MIPYRLIVFWIAIFASLLVVACRNNSKTSVAEYSETIMNTDSKAILRKLCDYSPEFQCLTGKLHVQYNQISAKGQIRLKKDECIWLSISVFGMEIARAMARPDSVFFLNRWEQTYYAGNYQILSQTFGIDANFLVLQAVLLGTDFPCYEKKAESLRIEKNNLIATFENRKMIEKCAENIKPQTQISIQELHFDITEKSLRENHIHQPKNNYSLHLVYGIPIAIAKWIRIPEHLQIDVQTEQPQRIMIKYSGFTQSETLSFPFQIPKNYTAIN